MEGATLDYASEEDCRNACIGYCGLNQGSYKEILFKPPKNSDVDTINGKKVSTSSSCWCYCWES